jgi:uncharacterized protein YerC
MSDSSSPTGTITRLLRQLPNQDEQVLQDIFNFYFAGLALRAKSILKGLGGVRIMDEEDLAILVMTAFLKDATAGELVGLRSRHDVWRMLSKRIRLRAINMVRNEKRKKKNEVGESAFRGRDGAWEVNGIHQQAGRSIEDLSLYHDELIKALHDPIERMIAILLLEGKDVPAISEELGRSPATIYRKLRGMRETWEGLAGKV